jgi:hypothetical protein
MLITNIYQLALIKPKVGMCFNTYNEYIVDYTMFKFKHTSIICDIFQQEQQTIINYLQLYDIKVNPNIALKRCSVPTYILDANMSFNFWTTIGWASSLQKEWEIFFV